MPDSAYKQILDNVKTQIVALELSGVTSTNVVLMKMATMRNKEVAALPAVLISPFGQPRTITNTPADTVGTNVLQYPVAIMVIQDGNQDQTGNYDRIALWLQNIFQEFYHKVISAVTAGNVYSCEVDHRDTFQPDAWFDNLDVGGMVLRFNCQLARS